MPEACRFGGDQELQGTVPGMIVPGSWLIKVVNGKARDRGKKTQRSKRFRTGINRWPYRLFQMFVDYKSKNETLYVDPEGTSS